MKQKRSFLAQLLASIIGIIKRKGRLEFDEKNVYLILSEEKIFKDAFKLQDFQAYTSIPRTKVPDSL